MNRKLLNVLVFTVGAAIGSAVTWGIVKTKYEAIAQEEIDSVKEEYNRLSSMLRKNVEAYDTIIKVHQNDDEDIETDIYEDDERDLTEQETEQVEYYKLTSKYRSFENARGDANNEEGGNGNEDEAPYINGPYVITPEEFSSTPPGYNAQPLDYFADGILADSWGVELDLEETIGEDALEHFGEYVDDVVYVRNERTEIDYEVTRDPRTYAEAMQTNSYPCYDR